MRAFTLFLVFCESNSLYIDITVTSLYRSDRIVLVAFSIIQLLVSRENIVILYELSLGQFGK